MAFDAQSGLSDRPVVEVLSSMHEQLQLLNHLVASAWCTGEDEDPPVGPPTHYPRPWDAFRLGDDVDQ